MTDPNDWVAALQRIAELESLLDDADQVCQDALAHQRAGYEARITELEAGRIQQKMGEAFYADVLKLEDRIAELEAAVQHADKVVEQLTAERDAALERAEKAERERDFFQREVAEYERCAFAAIVPPKD